MGLLCFIIISYTIAVVWGKRWLEVFPLSMSIIMLLTYAIGIVNRLNWIWLLKLGIILGCSVILFFYYCKSNLDTLKIKDKITVGVLIFTGVSVGMAFVLSSHLVIEWDDLSHWAITVKQMFYIDAIPNGQNAISGYNDYPPIGAIFIYWFLSDFKEFHEALIFPVYYFSVLICLTPFYDKIPDGKNKLWKQMISFVICVLLPGAFASTAMLNLKIDSFVAVLFVYLVVLILEIIFEEKELDFWNLLRLFSALSVMMLSKSVGIYLAIVVTFAVIVLALLSRKGIIGCAAGIAAEMFFYLSWKLFCYKYANASYISREFGKIQKLDYLRTIKAILVQMPWFLYPVLIYVVGMVLLAVFINKDKISKKCKYRLLFFTGVIDIFISAFCRYGYLNRWFEKLIDDGSKEYVTKHYIYYFCRKSVTFQLEMNMTYGISALECIMLITFIMLLVRFLTENDKNKKYSVLQIFLWVGFLIYVSGQLAMYRYMFHGSEASVLSAYSRYLMMYLGGLIASAFYPLYCDWLNSEDRKQFLGVGELLLGSMIFLSNIPFTYMCIFQYHEGDIARRLEGREKAVAVVEKVQQELKETDGGIWIAGEDDSGQIMLETRYHLTPDKEFCDTWVLDKMSEDSISEVLENTEEVEKIKYLAVDATMELSRENQDKLDKILEYYKLERKDDFPVCIYKL